MGTLIWLIQLHAKTLYQLKQVLDLAFTLETALILVEHGTMMTSLTWDTHVEQETLTATKLLANVLRTTILDFMLIYLTMDFVFLQLEMVPGTLVIRTMQLLIKQMGMQFINVNLLLQTMGRLQSIA